MGSEEIRKIRKEWVSNWIAAFALPTMVSATAPLCPSVEIGIEWDFLWAV